MAATTASVFRSALERYFREGPGAIDERAWRHTDVIVAFPQSGERIRGRDNLQAMQDAHPGGPPQALALRRIIEHGDLYVVEATGSFGGRPYHIVTILELRNGKIAHETRYLAEPYEAPPWRAPWVEAVGDGSASF